MPFMDGFINVLETCTLRYVYYVSVNGELLLSFYVFRAQTYLFAHNSLSQNYGLFSGRWFSCLPLLGSVLWLQSCDAWLCLGLTGSWGYLRTVDPLFHTMWLCMLHSGRPSINQGGLRSVLYGGDKRSCSASCSRLSDCLTMSCLLCSMEGYIVIIPFPTYFLYLWVCPLLPLHIINLL
jgi:hypothetical protein